MPILKHSAAAHPPTDPTEVEEFAYRAEVFHTPDGDVWFWAPRDQSALDTIALLLTTYEEAMRSINR